jgi:phosphohistidine phosphatase SixA
VLLVGHNPGIERLVALLVEGRSDEFRGMPPAGLAVLHLGGALEPGSARLGAFWSP